MTIKLAGKNYDFHLTGTVGLVYLAERVLGEDFDAKDKYHLLVLYYCCLRSSNKGEVPDLVTFISTLTSESFRDLSEFFWSEWGKLEGAPPKEAKEAAEGEG